MIPSEQRFRSTVAHYVAGRLRYPAPLLAAVAGAVGLGGADRVLDLGCGPGFLAIGFAPYAGEVVAMDPEPSMLAAARAAAALAKGRFSFVLGGSADLSPALGRFSLVTIGRAFHWMDRERVLSVLDRMIEPKGGVAIFGDGHPETPVNDWVKAWRAVRHRYAESDPRAHARDHEPVLRGSPFASVRHFAERFERRTGIDELVARALSLSTTSPEHLGPRRDAFEAELREALAPYARDGAVTELVEAQALLATRP